LHEAVAVVAPDGGFGVLLDQNLAVVLDDIVI
jgi:hypothetical protein